MQAEILAIGDELLSGQSVDTNSAWLSQRLEELGVRTARHVTIGDELAAGVEAFRQAIERADIVVATGGLGPTADDLTRQCLADAVAKPLQLDPEALESVRTMFARLGRQTPPQNQLQAMFPAGSRVVRNLHGTAPGIDLEVSREGRGPCRVVCLPGVPSEMVEMWRDSVAKTLAEFIGPGRVVRRRRIHCFGAGESQIEAMLPDLIRRGRQPTVGITAGRSTITLRIVAEGATEAECLAAMEPTVATIRQCLGPLVFGEEDDELQHAVVRLLRQHGKTLAVAECATGGLVAEWVGQAVPDMACEKAALVGQTVPDESSEKTAHGQAPPDLRNVFRGGMVVVDSSEPVEAMAAGCREQFGADLGLAVGPILSSPASGGEVLLALASAEGVQRKTVPARSHPSLQRLYLAKHALNFVRLALFA